jgi:hypothetical protein
MGLVTSPWEWVTRTEGGQVGGELGDKKRRKCKPSNGINSAVPCER